MSDNILWTDERIDEQIEDFSMDENARNLARHMRNDYEARIAALEAQLVQPYSHRNGETEPPTVNGWYWYYHEDDWYGMYHVTGDRYELGPISGVLSEEFEGQWWGPVVAPWEADDE